MDADQDEHAWPAHREKIRDAVKRERRDRQEGEEQEIAVITEIGGRKIPDPVEKGRRPGAEKEISRPPAAAGRPFSTPELIPELFPGCASNATPNRAAVTNREEACCEGEDTVGAPSSFFFDAIQRHETSAVPRIPSA